MGKIKHSKNRLTHIIVNNQKIPIRYNSKTKKYELSYYGYNKLKNASHKNSTKRTKNKKLNIHHSELTTLTTKLAIRQPTKKRKTKKHKTKKTRHKKSTKTRRKRH